jgi:tetratricopeptide (TPR) repeat protein
MEDAMGTASGDQIAPRISVAMIVCNEADVLAGSLASARQVGDETVILDTGSADQTVRIAERFGAKVIRDVWRDDFSAARNRLLQETRGDWILWLDAGEQLTRESARGLRDFIQREADPGRAYLLMVEVPPCDRKASSQQALRIRLMPRHAGLRFTGRVRETLRPSLAGNGLGIGTAPGRIVRASREHDRAVKADRARRDLRLVELSQKSDGSLPAGLLVARGEALSELGEQARAREAFLGALDRAAPGSTEMLEAYYGLLASFDGDPTRPDWPLLICLDALEAFSQDAQLLCALGGYMQAHQRLDLSAQAFRTAAHRGKINLETWHLAEIRQIAAVCLSVSLELQDRPDEARRSLEDALELSADSRRIRWRLIDLCVKQSLLEKAIELIDALPLSDELKEAARNAVRGACAAARADWTPALAYLQSAYVAGYVDPFCLRWLAVALLVNGQIESAKPILAQWLRTEPNSFEAKKYQQTIEASGQSKPPGPRPSDDGRHLRIDPPAVRPGGLPFQPSATSPADRSPH